MLTTKPRRYRRSRTKGARLPDDVVYVGRPTPWGNPFGYRTNYGLARTPAAFGEGDWEYEGRVSQAGMRHDVHHADGRITICTVRYVTRAECVETYRRMLTGDLTPSMRSAAPSGRFMPHQPTVEDVRARLAGRDLACWCPLNEPCHADVLLDIANREASC